MKILLYIHQKSNSTVKGNGAIVVIYNHGCGMAYTVYLPVIIY